MFSTTIYEKREDSELHGRYHEHLGVQNFGLIDISQFSVKNMHVMFLLFTVYVG